jgi:hypothetical protein
MHMTSAFQPCLAINPADCGQLEDNPCGLGTGGDTGGSGLGGEGSGGASGGATGRGTPSGNRGISCAYHETIVQVGGVWNSVARCECHAVSEPTRSHAHHTSDQPNAMRALLWWTILCTGLLAVAAASLYSATVRTHAAPAFPGVAVGETAWRRVLLADGTRLWVSAWIAGRTVLAVCARATVFLRRAGARRQRGRVLQLVGAHHGARTTPRQNGRPIGRPFCFLRLRGTA